ncbi:MAG: hypothetical protein K2P14_04680 [Anaeroplasmataceae bacterium]|nr:hypothetical protein [Anaeroplasmataceae bacterium]
MRKKMLWIFSGIYTLLELILLILIFTAKESSIPVGVFHIFIGLSLLGISLFFPSEASILIRYLVLFVLWAIHIIISIILHSSLSSREIFLGIFAFHFILTFASFMPTEKLNLNKYIILTELIVGLISLLAFPLSIPMAFIENEITQFIVVVVLGILSFIGEIGIGLFKQFKLKQY